MNNTNIVFPIKRKVDRQALCETFYNQLNALEL